MRELGDFTETDVERASALLPSAGSISRLMFAAIGLASTEVEAAGVDAAVFEGAEAFVDGILLALALREGEAVDLDRLWLSEGSAEIKTRGRHAVIAEHCDLLSVAEIERTYADELSKQVEGLDE